MTLVIDANIMAGALLGRSLPLFLELIERGVEMVAPAQMLAETRGVLDRDARLAEGEPERRMEELMAIVTPIRIEQYLSFEERARERLDDHGQSDWPLLASALALEADIWTKDRDLFGTGVPVWSTRNIRFVEGEAA